jgi:F0F1-type ATP synthase delta subunit
MEMVRQATQWKPILCETVNPGVIGGIRIHMGDREIDRTVASRLRLLRSELLRHVDAHLHEGRTFVTEN